MHVELVDIHQSIRAASRLLDGTNFSLTFLSEIGELLPRSNLFELFAKISTIIDAISIETPGLLSDGISTHTYNLLPSSSAASPTHNSASSIIDYKDAVHLHCRGILSKCCTLIYENSALL